MPSGQQPVFIFLVSVDGTFLVPFCGVSVTSIAFPGQSLVFRNLFWPVLSANEADLSKMGREELNQRQRDASTSTSTSGSGSSAIFVTEENEEMDREACPDEDISRTQPAKEPSFPEYWRGDIVFRNGDCVLCVVRLPSHLTIEAVKVVPGWIQRIYEKDVVLTCRYGFGRVSQLAVLDHCSHWEQALVKQMTAAATAGRVLEQLSLMEEVFPGSLLEDRSDSPSYAGSSEPSSSSPSNSSHHSASYYGKSRVWPRRTPQESHRSRNLRQPRSRTQQGTSNSPSGPVQRDQVDQQFQEAPMAPQQNYEYFCSPQVNYMRGFQWSPQTPATYSGQAYGSPPAVQNVLVPQPLYTQLQGQSQTFYPRFCTPCDYRGVLPTDLGYATQ
ncbi:hypothetical protein RvY_05874 [Ramazzottius varieornatus]|uniref:Uncharacterized protein n=1 Tax=Ramazzottius varieornatus TaxID=947166 RepID=A0A1D1UWJ6_RAMVA|nr:hypothetical protein RvY_05874 [Ramazzottius varieornatus]